MGDYNEIPKFKVGDSVKYRDAFGEGSLHKVRRVITHPGEYAGTFPILYELSNGSVQKEFRLEKSN
jgi:hypothetical protein